MTKLDVVTAGAKPFVKEHLLTKTHSRAILTLRCLWLREKNNSSRLAANTINAMYDRYKKVIFPKLLEDPLVPEEDKRKIRGLLMKPWNPYVRRHTAATEISKSLKDSVLIDQYLG